ncbi:alkene reductase [Pseudomonas sp. B21-044]|uniref:alkene reductase n=1 Tax=Pseudomonas sp. B21-044 TaxID=2895488 RepID=UPI00215E1993|nr:alkene reductase [Pseudomonas sp. B21-044]UVL21737.1 alkene reductase [Pseudomonas sp. B21-044]
MSSPQQLFTPYELGALTLPNRIVMAPMTRSRSTQPGDVANAMMAHYYAQRASAGLIISEATQISPQGKGYSFTPGIYSAEQVAGWRQVTDAVHAKGGRMFLQLWHVGRMSHASFHDDGQPVSPSALRADAQVWVVGDDGVGRMVDVSEPRALNQEDIQAVIEDYRLAARHARKAGFDGVEIHAGNGYLIDQFLRTTSNLRNDEYGGSRENRIRFLIDVTRAVAGEIGAQCTGVRLAPFITARGMNCPDVIPTILQAAQTLDTLGIAYLHLAEADWDDAPQIPQPFRHQLRREFSGAIIVAGRYTLARGQALLDAGLVDLVAFGRPFVANPDFPARLQHDWPLAEFEGSRLFGGDEVGYSDYPAYQ